MTEPILKLKPCPTVKGIRAFVKCDENQLVLKSLGIRYRTHYHPKPKKEVAIALIAMIDNRVKTIAQIETFFPTENLDGVPIIRFHPALGKPLIAKQMGPRVKPAGEACGEAESDQLELTAAEFRTWVQEALRQERERKSTIDAPLVAAPANADDDDVVVVEAWAANVDKQRAVFAAEYKGQTDTEQHAEQHVADKVERLIEHAAPEYEQLLGLCEPNAKFRQELKRAIWGCVRLQRKPPLSHGQIRNQLVIVKEAAAGAEKLRALCAVLIGFPEVRERELLDQRMTRFNISLVTLCAQARGLNDLSTSVERRTSILEKLDKGGRPKKMLGFHRLVIGLNHAFTVAIDRSGKANWNEEQGAYGGQFFKFVETVLPHVSALMNDIGVPFSYPDTANARGSYIHEMTREGAEQKKRPLYLR